MLTALAQGLLLIAPVIAAGLVHQVVRSRGRLHSLDRSLDELLFNGRTVFGRNKTIRALLWSYLSRVLCAFLAERAIVSRACRPGLDHVARTASLDWRTRRFRVHARRAAELAPEATPRNQPRRTAAARGRLWFFVLDHMDSATGCAIALRMLGASWSTITAGLVLAPALHVSVNYVAFSHRGLRSARW